MKKALVILTVLMAVLLIAGCATVEVNDGTTATENDQAPETLDERAEDTEVAAQATTYTLTDVDSHNNADDCWLVIDGKVYDVTDYVASHRGGETILEGCGREATDLFETRPMGSGTPHSADARVLLDGYFIGNLG